MSTLHELLSRGTAESLSASAELLDGWSPAAQAHAIATISPATVAVMLTDLHVADAVVMTARRGYQIPADPVAEAVQAVMTGRERAWISRYLSAAATTPPAGVALTKIGRAEHCWMFFFLFEHCLFFWDALKVAFDFRFDPRVQQLQETLIKKHE